MAENETATLDELATSVSALTTAVTDMRAGLVDRETVENIAKDVLEKQAAANPIQQRRHGYQPDDVDADGNPEDLPKYLRGTPAQRAAVIHQRSASRVASVINRPVEDVRHFQETADQLLLLSTALDIDPRSTAFFHEEYVPALRAMDTATAAEGTEFVPKALSANLIERVTLDLRVAALFPSIVMPTNPFDIPGRAVGRTRTGKHAEQTADTGQTKVKVITPGSRKITLTAVRFAAEALTSKDAEEDSIIPILPLMQEEIVDFIAADIEDADINGDTTGSHQDTDTTAADDPRKSYMGLRKLALAAAKTDASNAALTVAMLRTNRKKMGKYGVRPDQLAHVLSINAYIDVLSDTSLLTLEKYGPNATILTGELGKVDNVPVIVSEYQRTDLNAVGVNDGVTTDRTLAQTVYRRGFIHGQRREMSVQLLRELYAESDQDAVLATTRFAFAARFPTATEKIVAQHYNVKT